MYKNVLYTLTNSSKEKLNIYYDDALFNPRYEFGNLGIVCTPTDEKFYHLNENTDIKLFNSKDDDRKKLSKHVYLPIYAYLHGNIALSASNNNPYNCQFDSGLLGYIYTTNEKIKQYFPKWKKITKKRKEEIYNIFKQEIQILQQYLNGDVYYVEKENKNGTVTNTLGGIYDKETIRAYYPEFTQEIEKELKYI